MDVIVRDITYMVVHDEPTCPRGSFNNLYRKQERVGNRFIKSARLSSFAAIKP